MGDTPNFRRSRGGIPGRGANFFLGSSVGESHLGGINYLVGGSGPSRGAHETTSPFCIHLNGHFLGMDWDGSGGVHPLERIDLEVLLRPILQ